MVKHTPLFSPSLGTPASRHARCSLTAGLAWLGMMVLLLCANPALAARIEVSLDRNPVPLNESFTLVFTAGAEPDDDPDFRPLEQDFEILNRSQNSQFSFNNGHSSRRIEWQVTVMAKKTGTLTIPPIAFGGDRSEPFKVTVIPGTAQRGDSADADILLEVEAEPKSPYVQAQVIYTVRVLSRTPFGEARLGKPEAADTLVEPLNNGQEINGVVNRNGIHYRATEIRYALFPQKSGPLRIEPLHLEAQVASGRRSLLTPFLSQATRTLRVSSDAVELNVRPVPAAFTGSHWLPAENLALEDSWSGAPPKIASGEPITRTLTVKAQGATVGLLPELTPDTPPAGNIKQYPDQPSLNEEKRLNGLASVRQEKTALIVSQPGTYRMPALEIPWWNTRTDRLEIARLPERVLTVQPGAQPAPAEKPPAVSETAPAPQSVQSAPPPVTGVSPAPPLTENIWFWLALLFGAGWLATAAAWGFSRRPARTRTPSSGPNDTVPSERQWVAAVEQACQANDPLAARRALAAWAAQRWPTLSGMNTDALERRCGGELGRDIGLLNRCLYGKDTTEWQGQALWRSFRAYLKAEEPANRTRAAAELEPLYKL